MATSVSRSIPVLPTTGQVRKLPHASCTHGSIAAILTAAPHASVELWDAVKAGDHPTALELHKKLLTLWNAIKGLLAMAPEEALVRQADGSWATLPVASVVLGGIVRVRPGERVPLDGVLSTGSSSINQAPVTGESIPVDKAVGDPVFAGTINETSTFEFEVNALASNSTLARIIHAVEQAQGTRAPTQGFVDRFAAIYTPAVFVIVAMLDA